MKLNGSKLPLLTQDVVETVTEGFGSIEPDDVTRLMERISVHDPVLGTLLSKYKEADMERPELGLAAQINGMIYMYLLLEAASQQS